MRTPIATTMYFVERIIQIIHDLSIPSQSKKEILRYTDLAMSQLHLTQSFVNDLLDLG